MSVIEVRGLNVHYGRTEAVRDVSFSVEEKNWLMIAGPNGAGKSTVINAIAQGTEYSGDIFYDGADIRGMKPRQRARHIGVLAQNNFAGYAFSVAEVVRMGRYSGRTGMFGQDPGGDEMVYRALELTGLEALADKSILALSGGELQRTFLAQLFAQDPEVLLLDEPTNHLDLVYQKQLFELVRNWLNDTGRAVVSVVHDLSLARAYGTAAVLMQEGRIISCGAPADVLCRDNLLRAYGMDVQAWMLKLLSIWDAEQQ